MKEKDRKAFNLPLPLGPEGLNQGMIRTDPLGSYTGLVTDLDDKPVQDADDL